MRRRSLVFATIGIIAYLIGLIAFIPANWVIDQNDNLKVGGTIWNGQAVIASTIQVEWRFAPVASLLGLGFATDWHMSGGGTELAGSAISRGNSFTLENVSGQVDSTLVSAFFPNLPIACTFTGDLRLKSLRLGGDDQGGSGAARLSPSRCGVRAVPGPTVAVPALRGSLGPAPGGATTGSLVTLASRQSLVELRLSPDGALSVWPTAAAVRLAPILAGQRYDTRIE